MGEWRQERDGASEAVPTWGLCPLLTEVHQQLWQEEEEEEEEEEEAQLEAQRVNLVD